jgi:hypothetical protein
MQTRDVTRARTFVSRTLRATKYLARDGRIPRPLRWIAGLALLPIPGPVDEVILLLIAPAFLMFYREAMHEAWQRAEQPSDREEALKAASLSESASPGPAELA